MSDAQRPDWLALLEIADDAVVPEAEESVPRYDTADPRLRTTREERKAARDEARQAWRG